MTKSNGAYVSGRFRQNKRDILLPGRKIISTAIYKNAVLASSDEGITEIDLKSKESFLRSDIKADSIYVSENSDIYVSAENCVYILTDNGITSRLFDSKIVGIEEKDSDIWVLTENTIYKTDKTLTNDALARRVEGGKALALAVGEKTVFAATETNISVIHGKRMEWQNIHPGTCGMPEGKINSLDFDKTGYLWVGTDNGVYIYDTTNAWLSPDRISQLPKNAVYKTVFDEKGGVYFASDVGVIRIKDGQKKYFPAERWVGDGKINDIAVLPEGDMIFASTDCGLYVISSFEYTLRQKADYYEEEIEKHNIRRGFVSALLPDGSVHISDNDGLWTSWHIAAECFRYAVTGKNDALERARRGMNALLFLENITGIDGFPARAVRYPGERGFGNGHREWSLSPDKSCEWRGDTSSDEITGHFLGLSVYYRLCADEKEKKTISKALCQITDHIVSNSFRLVDRDGLPTTWAMWNPESLNHEDRWFGERGTNSLEFLMYLKVCSYVSKDEKWDSLYRDMIKKHHYPLNVMRHKIRDAHICQIDDRLAFLSSLILLTLEEDEDLKKYYLCGLEDHWQYIKLERQPFYTFVHAVFTGNDDDIAMSVRSLKENPLDTAVYTITNSKRKDLDYDTIQAQFNEPALLKEPLPYDEINSIHQSGNSFSPDHRGDGRIQPASSFLMSYWYARYTGILEEAEE